MPLVPAFCNSCSTPFNSGFFVEDSFHMSFSGCTAGPCPKCGDTGHIPDGIFNFVDSTIQVLSAPQRTIVELLALRRILEEAKAKSETKDQVTARIEREVPGLALLARLLPENKNELYGFLGVTLTAIALYTQSPERPPAQIVVNVTQVVQAAVAEVPKKYASSAAGRADPKQGRNEACKCGSGLKYKKCCGAMN
jgi:SEC-C motif